MNKIERFFYDRVKNNVKLKFFMKVSYQIFFLSLRPVKKVRTPYSFIVKEGFFFGFHDKTPWSASNKLLLAHRYINDSSKVPQKGDFVEVGYFSDPSLSEFHALSRTESWNWQQGSMLQWVGDKEIVIFNFWDGTSNRSKILDVSGNVVKVLPFSIGAVSSNGRYVVGYDFERLNIGMYGYGYSNECSVVLNLDCNIPKKLGFRVYDLVEDREILFKSVFDINNSLNDRGFNSGYVFVTHFIFSPDSQRILFLLRSFVKGKRLSSRLISCDLNGENLCVLPSGDMVSHLSWVNSDKILAYCSSIDENSDAYFIFTDLSQEYIQIGKDDYTFDGHPNYMSANNSFVTDSYPNRRRVQELSIYNLTFMQKKVIGQFYSPLKYVNEYRCDLHPRWDRNGKKICIDTTCMGKRSIGIINL